MQINSTNINNSNSFNFKGRVNFRDKKFIDDMIRRLDYFELEKAEKSLNEAKTAPKETFMEKISSIFSPAKQKSRTQPLAMKKSLSKHWDDSLSTLKTLVELKLPKDYVLNTKRSEVGGKQVFFELLKGDKYAFGLHTTIADPKFPVELMEQAAVEIKNGRDPLKMSGYKNQWQKD